jgi:TonB family protein
MVPMKLCSMRILECVLLVAVWNMPSASDTVQVGYIDCSLGNRDRLTPLFSNPCVSQPVGTLRCGQRVEVLGREGPWLKLVSVAGDGHYVGATSVSQKRDRFFALDIPVPAGPYIPDCTAFRPKTGKVVARSIYSPNPEYTKKARKARVQGGVMLALTIGTDGRAHDIKVLKRLGYGLDEKAVEAVQEWRWEPALEEGTPKESKILIEVSFNVY